MVETYLGNPPEYIKQWLKDHSSSAPVWGSGTWTVKVTGTKYGTTFDESVVLEKTTNQVPPGLTQIYYQGVLSTQMAGSTVTVKLTQSPDGATTEEKGIKADPLVTNYITVDFTKTSQTVTDGTITFEITWAA